MTVSEVIERVNGLKPNEYGSEEKIKWLRQLDEQIKQEIIDRHVLRDGESADLPSSYSALSELLVPAPYSEMYIHHLAAQIDYFNREYDGFNSTRAMFDACYSAFRNHFHATHRPLSTEKIFY